MTETTELLRRIGDARGLSLVFLGDGVDGHRVVRGEYQRQPDPVHDQARQHAQEGVLIHAPRWAESGQRPEFDEYIVVLGGSVQVETDSGTVEVRAGQAVLVRAGERVRYSTPEGAEFASICPPAFSRGKVHRDA